MLFLYACSYGRFGHCYDQLPNPYTWTNEHSFGQLLADHLGHKFNNRSSPGANNFHIFNTLLDDLNKGLRLKSTDIVIVRWSHITRAWTAKGTVAQGLDDAYYANYYNATQHLSMIVAYNYYLSSKLNCNFYFSVTNPLDELKSIDRILHKDLVKSKHFIPVALPTKQEELFPCGHQNKLGHERMYKQYAKHLDKKSKNTGFVSNLINTHIINKVAKWNSTT